MCTSVSGEGACTLWMVDVGGGMAEHTCEVFGKLQNDISVGTEPVLCSF